MCIVAFQFIMVGEEEEAIISKQFSVLGTLQFHCYEDRQKCETFVHYFLSFALYCFKVRLVRTLLHQFFMTSSSWFLLHKEVISC